MSQSPTPPNLTNPTTVADYNAIKDLNAAQADALDAQTRLITSQKAMQKALGEDTAAKALATVTQAAAVAAQQKALSDSQAAIQKSLFTVPDSTYTGEVKAGDKAGTMEAALLAAAAVQAAAKGIREKIGPKVQGKVVVLYGGAEVPDFQAVVAIRAQLRGTTAALDDAMKKMDSALKKANEELKKAPAVRLELPVTPSTVGAALDAANKIFGYFRTDYSIQGVVVAADDLQLLNSLASELSEAATVKMPAMYNANALLEESSLVKELNELAMKKVLFQPTFDAATTRITALSAAKDTDPNKPEMAAAATELKAALDQGKAAVALYDSFITKTSTADDKGKVPLTVAIQQDAVRQMLKDGAALLTAKISVAGGTYYTRKNLWSFFGSMPFFATGGVVINYTLLEGPSGRVLGAGVVPVYGGFHKVNQLPEFLRGSQAATPAK